MAECVCERGPALYYLSLETASGKLVDRSGYCRECIEEEALQKALATLGLHWLIPGVDAPRLDGSVCKENKG